VPDWLGRQGIEFPAGDGVVRGELHGHEEDKTRDEGEAGHAMDPKDVVQPIYPIRGII
jgi:hypothetical protein